ncbi:MAG: paraquat-inducible protein A [Deinococcus-Thermus bacterium]|jgi:paraquat-inducible protein A|nr:paraquat-inducible protein A [Deinococcota bacterium]
MEQSHTEPGDLRREDLDDLIVCPSCDALWRVREPETGGRTVCPRCHRVLIRPRAGAILQIVALGLTVLVLLVGALFLPFLEIRVRGLSNTSSIFDAALTFTGPDLVWLSLAVVATIVGIPMARVFLTTYALLPLLFGRGVLPGGRIAFRWAEELRPWSMAEIFILGCGVALVKVVDLARVEFGPAFWMFTGLVLITLLQDTFTCRWTVWKALDGASPDRAPRGFSR